MKKTCIEKYGVNNPFKSDVVRNKTKQFYLRNYGVEFNSQVPEIVEKAQKSSFTPFYISNADLLIISS